MIGVDSTDATKTVAVQINSSTGELKCELANESLSVTVGTVRKRDQNRVPTLCGISSSDPTVIVPIHVSPSGRLLLSLA